jgi:hypothetical protein
VRNGIKNIRIIQKRKKVKNKHKALNYEGFFRLCWCSSPAKIGSKMWLVGQEDQQGQEILFMLKSFKAPNRILRALLF